MRLMSFNTLHCMNYVTGKIDFEVMAEAIKNCDADIVGLNEIRDKGPHPDFGPQTSILSQLTGLNHSFFSKALDLPYGKYGNAILSRYSFESVQRIYIPDPVVRRENNNYYETRCLLKAKLDNGLTILVTHFGLNSDEHENAVATVLANLEDEKCILMGDFNVTPDASVIAPIREKMKDAAEVFDSPKLSFPSDAPDRKIDYIFVSKDIELVKADIPAIIASDHRPHTVEIIYNEE